MVPAIKSNLFRFMPHDLFRLGSVIWGIVMYLYFFQRGVLQRSMMDSMKFLYEGQLFFVSVNPIQATITCVVGKILSWRVERFERLARSFARTPCMDHRKHSKMKSQGGPQHPHGTSIARLKMVSRPKQSSSSQSGRVGRPVSRAAAVECWYFLFSVSQSKLTGRAAVGGLHMVWLWSSAYRPLTGPG